MAVNTQTQAPSSTIDVNADGYYNDVAPEDSENSKNGLDTEAVKKIALIVIVGVLVIAGALVLSKMM